MFIIKDACQKSLKPLNSYVQSKTLRVHKILTGNQTVVRKKLPFALTEWAVVKGGRTQYHKSCPVRPVRAAIPDLPVIYIP